MAVLGALSITPAFPEIRDALGISSGQVGLLITVFTLPGILLTPVAGVLADRYGQRMVLVPSLFLFAIARVACALATGFGLLLVLRTLQGARAQPCIDCFCVKVSEADPLTSTRYRPRSSAHNPP